MCIDYASNVFGINSTPFSMRVRSRSLHVQFEHFTSSASIVFMNSQGSDQAAASVSSAAPRPIALLFQVPLCPKPSFRRLWTDR